MSRILRGLESKHEQDPSLLIRDTRTIGMRLRDFFKKSTNSMVILIMLALASFLFYGASDFILILGLIAFFYSYSRHHTLPFRMPQSSGAKDYNDLSPTGKPKLAGGICFYGNELSTNEELWFTNDDMRTHSLIFGSTGSGKTEALVSIGYNALIQSSGLIYVDGKGDNTLYAKIYSMARSMGREDDILLINFMTGAKDIVGRQEKRLSNTMNPFSGGSSSMLTQLVVSMMDSSSASPDGDMWKGRAISFVESLMKILVYMRDQGKVLLDANTIRNYFLLDKLESMVIDKQFPREDQEPVPLEAVPSVVMEPIKNYVLNLPGYDPKKKGKQASQVLEQHGFITMQLTRVFTSLADTYGHILRVNLAEVDFKDVVLNRRILIVLLPALEKSPAELSNLGKVIVSSLKAMMAAGLGESVEGPYRDVISRKPTNAPTPFICVLDEYGYYAVEGFAVVPAQARSLGFSAIFAGQDLPAFQKASKEEALSIGANTNIKVCMKLEDPIETWDFFSKTAGEAFVTKVDSFQTKPDSILNNYLDTRSASSERRARIDLLDLKDQGVGEAHVFFKSKIVRMKFFFANPQPTKELRINHFLKVDKPPTKQLLELEARTKSFEESIKVDNLFVDVAAQNEQVTFLADSIIKNQDRTPIERGIETLIAYHNAFQVQHQEADVVEDISTDYVDIFSKIKVTEQALQMIDHKYMDYYCGPMLRKGTLASKIEMVERLSGKNNDLSRSVAKDLVRDMEVGTGYPPDVHDKPDIAELYIFAKEITDYVNSLNDKA